MVLFSEINMYEHIKLKPTRFLLNLYKYKYRESRKDLNDSGCIFEPFKINLYIQLKVPLGEHNAANPTSKVSPYTQI